MPQFIGSFLGFCFALPFFALLHLLRWAWRTVSRWPAVVSGWPRWAQIGYGAVAVGYVAVVAWIWLTR